MRKRTPSTRASVSKNIVPNLRPGTNLIPPMPSTGINSTERLLQGKYRRLTRKHLSGLLNKVFVDFTGLHFHIAWAPSASGKWNARTLPTACSVCCHIAGTSLKAQPICQICGPKQLARALGSNGEGLAFNCRLGVQNYWLPLRVRNLIIGVAYLQAPGGSRSTTRQQTPHAAAKRLSPSKFHRAARLFRLMIQYVQTLDVAELREIDLANAESAVLALEKEQARLHKAIQKHLRDPSPVDRRAIVEPHPEQIARDLIARIERDYAKPITLQEFAEKLTMNAAYLSDVFSRAVGVPFKAYLTELRMEKARVMLGDAHYNLSEIATAVGYASENRFRIAFKQATGLPPKLWRETMQANPPQMP